MKFFTESELLEMGPEELRNAYKEVAQAYTKLEDTAVRLTAFHLAVRRGEVEGVNDYD